MDANSKSLTGTPPRNSRVIMFCVPRSVSTAVTKCMSFVEDAEIWLEPYTMSKAAEDMYSLAHEGSVLPRDPMGNEEMYRDAADGLTLADDVDTCNLSRFSPIVLKREFDTLDPKKKFVFIKDMATAIPPGRYQYLPDKSSGFRYAFLTRSPIKAYTSLRERFIEFLKDDSREPMAGFKRPDPENVHIVDDLPKPTEGTNYVFQAQHALWQYVRDNLDDSPVILDIDDLLNDPAAMLPRFCNALGIPYTDSLLQWDESSDVTLKWKSAFTNVKNIPRYALWFRSAFKSTCFKASGRSDSLDGATRDIREAVENDMPYYDELYRHRLTI